MIYSPSNVLIRKNINDNIPNKNSVQPNHSPLSHIRHFMVVNVSSFTTVVSVDVMSYPAISTIPKDNIRIIVTNNNTVPYFSDKTKQTRAKNNINTNNPVSIELAISSSVVV